MDGHVNEIVANDGGASGITALDVLRCSTSYISGHTYLHIRSFVT